MVKSLELLCRKESLVLYMNNTAYCRMNGNYTYQNEVSYITPCLYRAGKIDKVGYHRCMKLDKQIDRI